MKVTIVALLVVVACAAICCLANEQQGRASSYNKYYSKPSLKNKHNNNKKNEEVENSFSFMKIVTFLANMFFGNTSGGGSSGNTVGGDDNSATSRQIFNLVMTAIDFLQNTFKQRSSSYKARGASSTIDEGMLATLYLLKGLVRSSVADNSICQQKYICEANKLATKSGSVGYMVSQVSTQLTGKFLGRDEDSYVKISSAGRQGRSGQDCEALYISCNETE